MPRKERLTEAELNHHVHIVGASGFGKTVLLSHIIKQKIQTHAGLLYVDLKGDLETINQITALARESNREQDLQIFSLSDPEHSCTWNPIAEGTATQLRDKIMLSLSWSEEYYKNQAASFLLKALIGLCYLRTRGVSFSLETILKLANNKDYVAEVSSQIPEGEKSKLALEECYLFLNEKENFKSLQGLRTQLESLILSDFGSLICGIGMTKLLPRMDLLQSSDGRSSEVVGPVESFTSPRHPLTLRRDDINLFQAINSKKIVCIFLDSRRYGETSRIVGRFLLQDLKQVSAKIDAEIPKSERKHFTVIMDEFADLAQEDFIGFLDRARSSKMAIVVAHQELSDLQRISKEFAARLTGNMSTLYAFLQKNPESAEMISGMAGTRLTTKETNQTERFLWWDLPTGNKSLREVEEFIIHPNQIKSLTVGRCIAVKKYPFSRSYIVDISKE